MAVRAGAVWADHAPVVDGVARLEKGEPAPKVVVSLKDGGERTLVWACEADSVDDDGRKAIASIYEVV